MRFGCLRDSLICSQLLPIPFCSSLSSFMDLDLLRQCVQGTEELIYQSKTVTTSTAETSNANPNQTATNPTQSQPPQSNPTQSHPNHPPQSQVADCTCNSAHKKNTKPRLLVDENTPVAELRRRQLEVMKSMRYDKLIDDTSVARYGPLDTSRVLFRAATSGLLHQSDKALARDTPARD